MALERHAHEQRKLSLWHVLSAEQVHRVDRRHFHDPQPANRFHNRGKCGSVREYQREITLHRREARKRPVPQRRPRRLITRTEWIELQFRNKCILPQLKTLGGAPRKLPGKADRARASPIST